MFDAPVLTLAWLAELELPTRTVRLTDGGLAIVGADTFLPGDEEFGTIAGAAAPSERSGDQAAAATITFLPADAAAVASLSHPSMQLSPVRFWLAEIDPATGEAVEVEAQASMLLDVTTIVVEEKVRRLEMSLVDASERLFLIEEGNTLSPRHHKSVWPGELGLDNATGKPLAVAWGVASPPRGTVVAGAAGGGGGGFATGTIRAVMNA